jgi:hypothetical protein
MRTIDIAFVIAGLAAWGCGSSPSAPPAGQASSVPASAAPGPNPGEPFNVGTIFPPGEGRDLVMSTCGSCHPLVCSARGQRSTERWDSIRKSHDDKLTGQSQANVTSMFAYLKRNFNETKPEPKVPVELAEQGCTPF